MNGQFWKILFVDPRSPYLIDRTGDLKLATTDPKTHAVYISSELYGDMLNRVLTHELGHCAIFSYDLLDDIHSVVPLDYWIDAEEWVCNFIADYGFKIFSVVHSVLGKKAWLFAPNNVEQFVA